MNKNRNVNKKEISKGVVHEVPKDLQKALSESDKKIETWNKLTPLGRNEWICWVTSVKKEETRKNHIQRLNKEIMQGKKRPCCWPGCSHR